MSLSISGLPKALGLYGLGLGYGGALSTGGGFLVTVAPNAVIAAAGDSTVRGQSNSAGNQARNSWPMQLASQWQAAGRNARASNFFGEGGCWGLGQTIANFAAGDNRFAYTGAADLTSSEIAGGNAFILNTSNPATFSFTPQATWDKANIYWLDRFGASFQYTWSAGAGGTTTITSDGSFVCKTTPATAPSLAAQALNLARVTGPNEFVGVDCYNSTRTELCVWNWGICGANSAQMLSTNSAPLSRKASYSQFKPDLALIEGAIINDWRQGVSVAASKANLTTQVQDAKAGKAGAQVLLVTPPFDNGAGGNTANQDQYVAAMKQVGVEQNVPVLDVRPTLQSWAYANAQGWMADSVHFTSAGAAVVAGLVRNAIRVSP